MKENLIWEPVFYNGIETCLEVTRCGKVKRVKKDWYGNNNRGKFKITYGIIDLNLKINIRGYYQLALKLKNGLSKTTCVHQLVASVFLGYKFEGHKMVVDHNDCNTLNNHVDNLRVVSQRENVSKERTIKSKLPTGVYLHKGFKTKKYVAQAQINGKKTYIGLFDCPKKASQAYVLKLKENNI